MFDFQRLSVATVLGSHPRPVPVVAGSLSPVDERLQCPSLKERGPQALVFGGVRHWRRPAECLDSNIRDVSSVPLISKAANEFVQDRKCVVGR